MRCRGRSGFFEVVSACYCRPVRAEVEHAGTRQRMWTRMTTVNNDLPGISDQNIPSGASAHLRTQMYALHEITRQTRIIANSHYLFVELARKHDFASAISETPAAYGTRIVVGSLLRHMVVGLASLFDSYQTATNLRRVLNEIIKEENRKVIEEYNVNFAKFDELEESRQRLLSLRLKINRDPFKLSLDRIIEYRKNSVAHTDLNPEFRVGKPIIRDLGLILSWSCAAVGEANFYCLARHYDIQAVKDICRSGAVSFAKVILRGIAADNGGSKLSI